MSKKGNLGDLITENKENAEELSAADKKSALNKDETEKKISKLILDNKKNALELGAAYKLISTQKKEIKKQAADLIRANKEKEKRKADLLSAKKELVLATEKAKHAVELTLVNKELTIQITERKQSEKALFESEERFRLLFNQAPLGYQALDFDGNFMEVNQTWLDILGYTREEVIGKWFGNFLSPAYQDGFRQRFPIFKAQGHIHSEFEMVHKNGSKIFIAFEGRIGYDNNGKFKQTHCILQDITGRKLAEDKLKESEQLFHHLFSASPDAVMLIDPTDPLGVWPIVNCNEVACTMNGYKREELIGQSIDILNISVGIPEERAEYLESLRRTSIFRMETFHRHHDGHIFPIELSTSIINFGERELILGIDRDITERKQAEEALLENEAKYRTLVTQSPDGIFIVDLSGTFLSVNKTMCDNLKYSEEELLSMKLWDIIPLEYLPIHKNRLADIIKGERKNETAEYEVKGKDGIVHFIEVLSAPYYKDKVIIGFQGIARDVTERKKFESEKELDRQVQEALNIILRISVENISLEESLDRILVTILSLTFLSLENKGGILFTEEGQNSLMLKTSYNLSNEIQSMCAQVPFGHCFCGRAATTRQIQFVDCIDERHENRYEGIKPHGHYNVPILTSEKVLGVIIIYLAENHKQEKFEHDFLLAVADILSGLIQRKRAEEELKQANSELANLHNNLDEAVFSVDLIHNKMLHASIAHETVFGHSPAAFFANPQLWYEMVVPEDKPIVDAGYPVLFSGKNLHNEFRIVHPDGQVRWIEAKMNPTLDANGKLIRIDGIATNITEHKKAEEVIHKNEAKQGKLVANIGDVIVIIDKNGINQYKSPNITALFGWKPEELVGKSTWDHIHPDDRDSTQKIVDTIAKKPNTIGTTETRYRRKDGRYVWIEITLVNLLSDPDVLGIIGNYHEITERKQAELELIKAKEKAEESDRLKSAFLANMSHEVRTPLNSIIGFSELLADPDFEEEQKDEFIQSIIMSGNNLLNIISDIMDISKMESGEITIRKKQINAQKFISTVKEGFAVQTDAKKLELKLILPDNDVETFVFADVERLRQIFNNLMSNAIKFTANGSIEIGFQPKGNMVEFYVKDTGIGVPAEYQDVIFDRFRQVEDSKTRTYGGNGLGLAISKNLVELMGGKMQLVSESGIGSEFYFTLPVYKSEI